MADCEVAVLRAGSLSAAPYILEFGVKYDLPVLRRIHPDFEQTLCRITASREYLANFRVFVISLLKGAEERVSSWTRVAKVPFRCHLVRLEFAALTEPHIFLQRLQTVGFSIAINETDEHPIVNRWTSSSNNRDDRRATDEQ